MKILLMKLFLISRFLLVFIREILLANLRVAYDVITPHSHSRPGVIAIPLSCRNDIEITLFSIIVSLTPGTLALDISPDKRHLYIHAMFIKDKKKLINRIKNNFEKPLLRILA